MYWNNPIYIPSGAILEFVPVAQSGCALDNLRQCQILKQYSNVLEYIPNYCTNGVSVAWA